MSEQVCKQFCGEFSGSMLVLKWSSDNGKQAMIRAWAAGEDKGKKVKIRIDTSLQQINKFVNGFVEYLWGECWYPNKSKFMENKPW